MGMDAGKCGQIWGQESKRKTSCRQFSVKEEDGYLWKIKTEGGRSGWGGEEWSLSATESLSMTQTSESLFFLQNRKPGGVQFSTVQLLSCVRLFVTS